MRTRGTLAMVACVAAASLGAVLWFSGAGSSRSLAQVPPPGASAGAEETDEPISLEETRLSATRSSAAVNPALEAATEAGGGIPPLPASGSTGSVRGRVLDQDDVPVASARVSLARGQHREEQETDARGRFAFAGVQRGSFQLYVDGASLPEGFLPPWRQSVPREVEGPPTGFFGTAFRLTEGEEYSVDLRVFEAGSVHGRLLGSDGEPIPDTPVCLRSTAGVVLTARTDEQGGFAIAKAYPGTYSTGVTLGQRPESAAAAPLPIHFDLGPGEVRVLPDLIAGQGGHILRGAVVDETGRPLAGLAVLCEEALEGAPASRWETVTDGQGRYELGRVPSTKLLVRVAPDESRQPEGRARIAKEVAPLPVDTRAAPEVLDLGVVGVEATHPFHLLCRVRVDPAWAEQNGFEPAQIRVDWRKLGETFSRLTYSLRSAPAQDREPTQDFPWACATPHPPVEFRVVLRNAQGVEQERRESARPAADATQEVLVTFP